MRFIAVCVLVFFTVSVYGREEAAGDQTDQSKARGTIYATLKVADDLKAEFLDGPNSELPDDIVEKISPLLMTKARETHVAMPADDAVYRVAIDWRIVSVNGQDQMKFEYSNSEPYPVRKVEPEYTQRHATGPVEIFYVVGVAADGSVTDINRDAGSSGNIDLYHAGRDALKRWKFSPQYRNGVAIAGEARLPIMFNSLSTFENQLEVPRMRGL